MILAASLLLASFGGDVLIQAENQRDLSGWHKYRQKANIFYRSGRRGYLTSRRRSYGRYYGARKSRRGRSSYEGSSFFRRKRRPRIGKYIKLRRGHRRKKIRQPPPPKPSPPVAPTRIVPTTPTPSMSSIVPELEGFENQADWEQGTPINIEIRDVLQLQSDSQPFNFIWIAASGRGTIVKVDTITGQILGEYRSGPISAGFGDPSRTTVDSDGSVWLANRAHNPGTIIHIGLVENNQCDDRNGNGVIETSTGLSDILDWANETGDRSVQTAADECIVAFVRVNSTGTRHLSLDRDNNVWVGGFSSRKWDLVRRSVRHSQSWRNPAELRQCSFWWLWWSYR